MTAKGVRQVPWPKERDDRLRELLASGHTLHQVADILGMAYCAVLGRKRRLKLPLSYIVTRRSQAAPPPADPVIAASIVVNPDGCRWVMNGHVDEDGRPLLHCLHRDPPIRGAVYCGNPIRIGAYCRRHWRMAHRPQVAEAAHGLVE